MNDFATCLMVETACLTTLFALWAISWIPFRATFLATGSMCRAISPTMGFRALAGGYFVATASISLFSTRGIPFSIAMSAITTV